MCIKTSGCSIGENLSLEAEESNQHHNHLLCLAAFTSFVMNFILYIVGLHLKTVTLSAIACTFITAACMLTVRLPAHGALYRDGRLIEMGV